MLGRQPGRDTAGRTAPSASSSWENPAQRTAANANEEAGLIKGTLTVAGVMAFARRNGGKIAVLAVVLFVVGCALLSILPVRYAATALVVVDPREARVTAEQEVLPGIGQDAAALQSLIEIAKSDGFLRPLIDQLKVAEDDDIAHGETNPAKILDKFRGRLDISRRGLTYVIAMTFVSNNPQQAARYANAIAEAFVTSQSQVHTDATDEAAGFLNSRLKTLSDRLRTSEDAVAAYKAEHRIVNAGRESTTRQLRVTELTQQASAARLRAEEAKNRYEQAQRDLKANVDSPSGSRTDLLTMLRAQRTQLNDQIAQKRAVLGERHPDLIISLNQLSELNRQIDIERKRAIDSAKSDYETLLDQQKSLENQLKSFEGDMLVDGQAAVKLQELQRDADANRNIYEQFLSRFKTTDEQRRLQSSQAKVVSGATAPTRPTRPSLSLILVALAIGSMLMSVAIIALSEVLGVPVRLPARAAKPARPAKPQQEAPAQPDLPVWSRISIREGAADMRGLLDTIAVMPGRRGKVVLVTSGESGVGKSAVARSLNAAAISRGMLSVLIEVTSPQVFARSQPSGEAHGDDAARALKTDLRSLHLLLDRGQNVAVAAFPGDVRTEFNLVVIDAPSLAGQPDVASLSPHVDFTVLVASDSASSAGAINKAKSALEKFSHSVIGLVVNQIPRMVVRA
jgi:uncharacterized protein involved in exopolysaccharide biosynthesis